MDLSGPEQPLKENYGIEETIDDGCVCDNRGSALAVEMGMENQFGRPVRTKQHEVMETKDGQKIMMHGEEVMRVELLNREQGLKGQG